MQYVSRIAPTPSGYLHVGNAVNFLLTWLAVRSRGGTLHLRIDDLDRARCRPGYIDDIFVALEWLGIEPDAGPSDRDDFLHHYSQTLRYDSYKKAMLQMPDNGADLFACTCSRKTLDGKVCYPGTCRHAGNLLKPLESSMRIAVAEGTMVTVEGKGVDLAHTMGDFVLWRRDDIPAYQLVSVLEDERLGVNLLIRGRDLFESSAAQRFLAPYLNAETFAHAEIKHHDLLLRADGTKFSKSDSAYSLRQMRTDMGERHALKRVYDEAQRLLRLKPKPLDSPNALLDYARSASSSGILQLF